MGKSYDSSFAIHIKHLLFKEKKKGKEGLREEEEWVYLKKNQNNPSLFIAEIDNTKHRE